MECVIFRNHHGQHFRREGRHIAFPIKTKYDPRNIGLRLDPRSPKADALLHCFKLADSQRSGCLPIISQQFFQEEPIASHTFCAMQRRGKMYTFPLLRVETEALRMYFSKKAPYFFGKRQRVLRYNRRIPRMTRSNVPTPPRSTRLAS